MYYGTPWGMGIVFSDTDIDSYLFSCHEEQSVGVPCCPPHTGPIRRIKDRRSSSSSLITLRRCGTPCCGTIIMFDTMPWWRIARFITVQILIPSFHIGENAPHWDVKSAVHIFLAYCIFNLSIMFLLLINTQTHLCSYSHYDCTLWFGVSC